MPKRTDPGAYAALSDAILNSNESKALKPTSGFRLLTLEPLDWQKFPAWHRIDIIVAMETYVVEFRSYQNELMDVSVHPTFGLALMHSTSAICRAELTSKVKYTTVQ